MKRLTLSILAAAVVVFSGCTTTTYTAPGGSSFTRTSFLNNQSVGKVSFKDGEKSLEIEAYNSDQTTMAAAVVSAAVSATLKASKP